MAYLTGHRIGWQRGALRKVGYRMTVCQHHRGMTDRRTIAERRLVLSRGQKLIRPMVVIVSAVMSIKLLWDSHGSDVLAWLATLHS